MFREKFEGYVEKMVERHTLSLEESRKVREELIEAKTTEQEAANVRAEAQGRSAKIHATKALKRAQARVAELNEQYKSARPEPISRELALERIDEVLSRWESTEAKDKFAEDFQVNPRHAIEWLSKSVVKEQEINVRVGYMREDHSDDPREWIERIVSVISGMEGELLERTVQHSSSAAHNMVALAVHNARVDFLRNATFSMFDLVQIVAWLE